MTMAKFRVAASVFILLAASPGWGQTLSVPTPTVAMTVGSFERLSSADRRIARALFETQRPTSTSVAPLSLDQIAVLRTQEEWRDVFAQMQMQGLMPMKNFSQVVKEYARRASAARSPQGTGPADTTVVVTTGGGSSRMIAVTSRQAAPQD